MDELKALLQEKYPTIDFDRETALVSDGLLDSLQVVELIAELEDVFGIEVTMEYIQPVHFESVESIWAMVEELQ